MTPLTIAGLVFLTAILVTVAVFIMVTTGAGSPTRQIKRRLEAMGFGATGEGLAGGIARLEFFTRQLLIGRRLGLLLEQANVSYRPGQFFLLSLFPGLAGLLGGVLLGGLLGEGRFPMRGVVLSVLLALFLGALPYLILLDRRRTRIKRFTEQFPDALDMIARSLRAGHGFNVAMQTVAQEMPDPLSAVFRRTADEQSLGLGLHEAMKNLTRRVPILDVEFFVSGVVIQRETGGNLAEIMDKLSHVIRERFRVLGQIRVYTAQGRMTGYILAALPITVGFILYLLNPSYIMTLFQEQIGLYMIGMAVTLQIMGFFVIRKIINIQI